MLTQSITAYQKFENNLAPFALAVLNICLPNATKREMDKIVENTFFTGNQRPVAAVQQPVTS